ncbi:polysaccharide biosynthesis/export family protein [Vibrio cholerae]|nr:polysaccharide biosynthesis/export family protein [Vibrio cholerae]
MIQRTIIRAICLLVCFSVPVAVSQTPTPEQIEMFKKLPLEQQQALASKYGISFPNSVNNSISYENPRVIMPRQPSEVDSLSGNRLTTKPIDEEQMSLERFGLSLFSGSPSTFAPIGDVPVPSDYTIGAGDEIVIQLFGKENQTHRLRVNRAGVINFPSLGPIQVAGLKFSEVRQSLEQRVEEQMIGIRSDISLGELRTMQIFVMGDAYKPGAYTVSALTTLSQAIYYSGGFSQSGALRNIQLKRDGQLIVELDLYDLLLKGDSRNDVRLMPSDVVFIGSVDKTVEIKGEVNRPAIYEIRSGETYQDLIKMAGGFTASAYREKTEIKRYSTGGTREVLTLNLNREQDLQVKVLNGDSINVLKNSQELTHFVEVAGDVKHPGFFEWKPNLRIADLFQSAENAFNPTADINYAIVVREVNLQRDIQVHQINLGHAILEPTSSDNLRLESRDRLLVFNRFNYDDFDEVNLTEKETENTAKTLEQAQEQAQMQLEQELEQQRIPLNSQVTKENMKAKLQFAGKEMSRIEFEALKKNTRRGLLAPILLQLHQQSRFGAVPQFAEVVGEVKFPGRYPIPRNMTVADLIEAAGGLTYNAYSINADLARREIDATYEKVNTQIVSIDLRQALSDASKSGITIHGMDKLNVLQKPAAKIQQTVVLQGEVKFPGTYTVRQGETLADLLKRAGGLTEFANPRGAIFTREALRLQEQKLLNQYAADIRAETAKKTFRSDRNVGSMITDPDKTLAFVEEASRSKVLGRMVVQLDRIMHSEESADFILEDGDFLFVPTFRNTISIMGEVQVPITYILDSKLNVEDYLKKAGGIKKQADEDRIFVVRADGSVYKPISGYWFGNNKDKLEAGDTIVVPLDTDYRDALSVWTAATQILYQAGIAVNALK